MTHSSQPGIENIIAGRDYEVALNEMVMEQKQDVAEQIEKRNVPLIKGCMIALVELERLRRELLTGEHEPELSDFARQSIDGTVRVRMDRHRMIREGIL